ncbi:MAG: glycosyltransferase family 9 protein [Planctomycetota bacterium]|nr:glycosyltransferase family 9 protein [Planctomycetota bacterium]
MPPSDPGGAPRRVLIIRPSALGDVARTVPALASLRKALPGARIDWLVNEGFVDAVAHHPALYGTIAFPRQRFGAMLLNPRVGAEALAWLGRLRRNEYDLVFDLQGLMRSGYFAWSTRAPRRVGFADAKEFGWLGYNQRHKVDPDLHTVDRMRALVEAEGFKAERDMRLYVGEQDKTWLAGFLAEHGLAAGEYFTIAPTARWLCKCWPIERYAQVVRRLLDEGLAGKAGIILASPSEREQVQPLVDAMGPDAPLVFPRTSVGQMMAILSRTRLLVCNDSAPLHIAVGFDRPIVSIFGPTDPRLVGPYRRADAVIEPEGLVGVRRVDYRHSRDDQTTIARVTFDAVWARICEQASQPGLDEAGMPLGLGPG